MSSLLNGLFPSLLGNPPLQRLASRDLPFYSAALLPKPPSEREARLPARQQRPPDQAAGAGRSAETAAARQVFSAQGSSSLFKLTSVYHIPRDSPYRFTEIFSSAKQQVVKKSSSIERFPGCKKQRRFSQQTGAAFFVSFSPPAQCGSLWGAVRSFRANNRSGAHLR